MVASCFQASYWIEYAIRAGWEGRLSLRTIASHHGLFPVYLFSPCRPWMMASTGM